MKNFLVALIVVFLISPAVSAQACTPLGDQVTYGTADTWIGYVYDNMGFATYMGYANEGTPGNPNFNETFGGDYVNYATNGCPIYTETFSVRYKLTKNFAAGNYQITVGADDGYRLSLDGGATWVINQWFDQAYNFTTYVTPLSGTYNLVLEYYENSGGNRVSFDVQTVCTGPENQSIYGTGNIWKGYIYDGINFNQYSGLVTEGVAGNPNFDESFGGTNVAYNTSACAVQTETFSARYRLTKNFANGNYIFTAGGDDGYRLSLDGGSTWVINRWFDQSYSTSTYSATLNGTYNLVFEYYENSGGNRVSFNLAASLLPVQLIKFDGKLSGKNILLHWTVTKEIDVNYYEIEHSSDGINFLPLKKMPADNQLTPAGLDKNYQFTDASPMQGSNYYRLRMVDIDGKYTYSPVINMFFKEKGSISIFPAISNGNAIYLRSSSDLKNASVELYDITGKKLKEIKLLVTVSAGQTLLLPVNANALSKGTYLLLCRSAGELITKQLIIIE
jgi:hypothetical protein